MSDHSMARATIIAALIGLLGSIGGIILGNKAGANKASEEMHSLEARMRQQESAVAALQSQLAERDETIRKLREEAAPERASREPATEAVTLTNMNSEESNAPQESSDSSSTGSSLPLQEEPAVVAVEEVSGVAFSLRECRRSNSVVTCDFTIVNRDNDRKLEICTPCYGVGSRLVDSEGNQYRPEAAYLGSGFTHRPNAVLASGVPMRAGIRFNGLQPNATRIALLELGFRIGFSGNHTVQFRDIALR